MTFLEIERLVRKISDLLQGGGNAGLVPKLAEDFIQACHAANVRLQQCEAMIQAGDRHQAIQLAETPPNLLDVVTALEFAGCDDWRNYCQQSDLPSAERIDRRSVQVLNDCYAQGITTDHPLYAAYRRAVLSRNDAEALKALQSITRLNPKDTNAATELARLDSKVLGARLSHLGELLEGGDSPLVVREIEAIEGFGFQNQPQGEYWREAQTMRCGVLLQECAAFRNASKWLEALSKIDFVQNLERGFSLSLPPLWSAEMDELEKWARGEQEKDRRDREFKSLVGELHYRVQQSEEKDTSARYVKLPELQEDFEALHKTWRSLADFLRAIPEDAAMAFRKRSALLEGEIARRTTLKRRAIVGATTLALLIGSALAWFALAQMKGREFARQLEGASSARQVRVAEGLLRSVRAGDRGFPIAALKAATAKAETFVRKELSLLSEFEVTAAKLPQELGGEADAARIADVSAKMAETKQALDAMAPDLQSENQGRLHLFDQQWQNFLRERAATINALLDERVSAAEKQARNLDYRLPLDAAGPQINSLSLSMKKVAECEQGFTNYIALRQELLQRSDSVRVKLAAYEHQIRKVEDGIAALRKATALKEFSDSIKLIASSEFSASEPVRAALNVQALNVTDESAVRLLVGATNSATWASIRNGRTARFFPEAVMPTELRMLKELESDPAIMGPHHLYRLWLDRAGEQLAEWITAGMLNEKDSWSQIPAWSRSRLADRAIFEDHDYGFFNGQYKLSATQPVYRVEDLGALTEAACFSAIGLEKVRHEQAYAGPLLAVLDRVKSSSQGSPLFRAYLLLKLEEVMELQPDAWGLSFCPSARQHVHEIKKIVSGQLLSGDWFVPAKTNALGGTLEQFLVSANRISYMKQAEGLWKLEKALSESGLRFAGFADLEGKPSIVPGTPPGELWGYTASTSGPVLLTGKIDPSAPGKQPALPLSPLWVSVKSAGQLLEQAGVTSNDPSFRGVLPPLFNQTLQQ
jgi:hypothetical protein